MKRIIALLLLLIPLTLKAQGVFNVQLDYKMQTNFGGTPTTY